MKAAWHESSGGFDVLQYGDLPEPDLPAASEILISMAATSLDRVDLYWREGSHGMRLRWPQHVGGRDVAGTVVSVGSGVSDFAVGDRVAASAERTHAELVLAPAELTFPLPDNVSFESAGVAPTAGRSAFAALVSRAQVQPGETVLIVAAGSGVGSFGMQIAQAHGCKVIATAGTQAKRDRAVELGAVAAIDHYNEDLAERVAEITDGQGVHAVLDHAGAPVFASCIDALAPGGRYVTCGVTAGHKAELHLGKLFVKGLSIMGVGRPGNHEIAGHLRGLFDLIGNGTVSPEVAGQFPLSGIDDAHRLLDGPDCFGKVLLVP